MDDRRNWGTRPFIDPARKAGVETRLKNGDAAKASKAKKPLTPEQKEDAKLLREAWAAAEAQGRDIKAIDMARIEGCNPTNISNYMSGGGNQKLNIEWKMRFARYLDLRPQQIWPKWEFSALTSGDILPSATEFARQWTKLDKSDRAIVNELLARLSRKHVAISAK